MAQLNTKIVLRNDSLSNWEQNKSVVLLKGEVGIAFDKDGKTLMKIGDGIKTWEELDWFHASEGGISQSALDALSASLEALNAKVGDPSNGETAATGIYGQIAALAESMGLLNKKVDEEIPGKLEEKLDEKFEEQFEEKLDLKLDEKLDVKVDEKIAIFANQITDDGKINTVMELIEYVDTHGAETVQLVTNVNKIQALVGDIPIQDQIALVLDNKGYVEKTACDDLYEKVKYNISSVPYGTLVNYGENEIRVMCPADTQWTKQNVGNSGNANMYYMAFKAYAPEGAVSFKEGDRGEIVDEMFTFDGDFSGVDKYGRGYSICWLALASYDEANGTWTYFGKNSTVRKYVGWDYVVEWYDADGKMISSDRIRINLSNEDCHNNPEPYYMSNVIKEVVVNGVLCDVVNNRVEIELTGVVKSSDEIAVNEDGTLAIQKIDASKIVTSEGSFIILNGGSASV